MLQKDFDDQDIDIRSHEDLQEIFNLYLKLRWESNSHFTDIKLWEDKDKYWSADILRIQKTNREIHIFEIKSHRSDFLNDNKWEKYLDFCTHFWFVRGLGKNKEVIDLSEIPEQVGLIDVIPTFNPGFGITRFSKYCEEKKLNLYWKKKGSKEIAYQYYKEFYPDMVKYLFWEYESPSNAFIKIVREPSRIQNIDNRIYSNLLETILFNKFIYA